MHCAIFSLCACHRNIYFFLEKEAIVSTGRQNMYAVVLIWFYVVMHTEGSFDCLLLGGLLPPIKGCFLNMIPVFIQTERQIWLLAAALEIVLFHSDLIIVQRLY